MRILRASCLRRFVATASVACFAAVSLSPSVFAAPETSAPGKISAPSSSSGAANPDPQPPVSRAGGRFFRGAASPGLAPPPVAEETQRGVAESVDAGQTKADEAVSAVASVDAPPTTAARPSPASSAPIDRSALTRPSRGERLVRSALSYRGTPYRFGARGDGAFDCSGFTSYIFSKAGSPLPRTAAEQYRKGARVPKDQLKPGDLVFFKNTYKRGVSHVGVYIGGGQFVHASSGGGRVRVDSLSKSYYLNHWAGARRPR